jgi:hypothetical protein
LIPRVWHVDLLRCPICQNPMWVIALIDDPRVWRGFFVVSAPGMIRLPGFPRRAPHGPTPTNSVTPPPPSCTTRTCSRIENRSFEGRFGVGLLPGSGLFLPSLPQNRATSHAFPGRSAAAPRPRPWR